MTWQLGHQMHARHRTIPPRLALQQAQEFLSEMDFVGFFEDMLWDVSHSGPHSSRRLILRVPAEFIPPGSVCCADAMRHTRSASCC